MRISDWSSDVCSSDLVDLPDTQARLNEELDDVRRNAANALGNGQLERAQEGYRLLADAGQQADADAGLQRVAAAWAHRAETLAADRSEEHTSELQSLMRTSYAVFCLKKKKATLITNA